MSKVGRQNSGLVDVRAMAAAAATGFGARVTRASSTTASKTAQMQAHQPQHPGKSSIVSTIEVNMESSYDTTTAANTTTMGHCKPNAPPPPPISVAAAAAAAAAVKKKRLALGNISNAEGLQPNSSVGQSNNPPVAPKDAKKYRFSGANIVNIAMPSFGQKKSDQAAKKPSSKFNHHYIINYNPNVTI